MTRGNGKLKSVMKTTILEVYIGTEEEATCLSMSSHAYEVISPYQLIISRQYTFELRNMEKTQFSQQRLLFSVSGAITFSKVMKERRVGT